MTRSSSVLFAILSLAACAPSRIVKPLKKGEHQLGLSAGGPLISYTGATIPVPLTSLTYATGITSRVTAFAGLHTTSLLFGVVQTDIGICTHIYQNTVNRIGLSASPVVNFAMDKWNGHPKLWPQADVNCYWTVSDNNPSFIYLGASNWFELAKYRAHEERQPEHWFVNPHLGLNYSRRNWSLVVEAKYLAGSISSEPNVVEYKGIAGHGALGVYLGVNRTLK